MRSYYWVAIASLLVLATGCSKAQPAAAQAPDLLRPGTIKDIMDSMVDPSGDFIFGSVEEVADQHGVHKIAPSDDTYTLNTGGLDAAYDKDNWQSVRLRLMVLLEAPNLLVMPGRQVAPQDATSQNPDIELPPAQIQKLIDGDRVTFIKRARRLQDAAAVAMKAVDEKNTDGLFKAEDDIDKACEACHLHYWYPNDKRAKQAAQEDGLTDY